MKSRFVGELFDALDRKITGWMAQHGLFVVRINLWLVPSVRLKHE